MLAVLLVLPLGLWLVWRNERYSANFKRAFLSLGTLFCLIVLGTWITNGNLQHQYRVLAAKQHRTTAHLQQSQSNYQEKADDLATLQDENDKYHDKMAPYENLAKADAKKRKVTDALDALPGEYTLTVDDKAKVQAVRKAFSQLSPTQKAYVDESSLKTLENKITELEKKAAADAAQAKKEAAEAAAVAKKKAEEEARGYDTGITYDQLARTPDSYEGKKVKFYGEVAQVLEDSDSSTVQVRLAINGDYDHMMLCEWSSSSVTSRVLEDDYITISGVSEGLVTYESTMGGDITIPSVMVAKVDQ
jgi:chemotaxis protein histidine kinase CheA